MSDMKVDENQKSYYPGIVSNRYVSCFHSAEQLLCSGFVEKILSLSLIPLYTAPGEMGKGFREEKVNFWEIQIYTSLKETACPFGPVAE